MNQHAYAVIMAGGRGERFWPLSTSARPKQFLSLFGGKPLIAHAVDRLEGVVPPERVIVITSADLVPVTAEAAPSLPRENIIGEPCPRDTAAAVALACGIVSARDPEGVVAILTADQLMTNVDGFRRVLSDSFTAAEKSGDIVTIGIKPSYPATGFGYIEAGELLDFKLDTPIHKASRFVEKPDVDKATAYLESGRFYWNAGMFIWHVRTMAAAVRAHAPALDILLEAPSAAKTPEALAAKLAEVYPGLTKISVDYAIMEHSDNIAVAMGDFGWDDVGTWSAIAAHFDADENGNIILGTGEALDSKDNVVVSQDGHMTALLGVSNLVVVHSGNATLVCPRDRAQELKTLVKKIGARPDGAKYI